MENLGLVKLKFAIPYASLANFQNQKVELKEKLCILIQKELLGQKDYKRLRKGLGLMKSKFWIMWHMLVLITVIFKINYYYKQLH